jgi:hypothetical protein
VPIHSKSAWIWSRSIPKCRQPNDCSGERRGRLDLHRSDPQTRSKRRLSREVWEVRLMVTPVDRAFGDFEVSHCGKIESSIQSQIRSAPGFLFASGERRPNGSRLTNHLAPRGQHLVRALARSAATIATWRCRFSTNVVGSRRSVPKHDCPGRKPVHVTVRYRLPLPTAMH